MELRRKLTSSTNNNQCSMLPRKRKSLLTRKIKKKTGTRIMSKDPTTTIGKPVSPLQKMTTIVTNSASTRLTRMTTRRRPRMRPRSPSSASMLFQIWDVLASSGAFATIDTHTQASVTS